MVVLPSILNLVIIKADIWSEYYFTKSRYSCYDFGQIYSASRSGTDYRRTRMESQMNSVTIRDDDADYDNNNVFIIYKQLIMLI